MGVGAAYASIIELLKDNQRVFPRVEKVFFFVGDQAMQSCRSDTGDELLHWYYRNSMVYVAQSHHIWEYTEKKKPKKRFGNLVKSENDDMQGMLAHHKDEIVEMMKEATGGWEEPAEDSGEKQNGGGGDSEDELVGEKKMADPLQSPIRLPPMGNFALSPSRNNGARTGSPSRGR